MSKVYVDIILTCSTLLPGTQALIDVGPVGHVGQV